MIAIYLVGDLPRAPLPDEVSDKTGHLVAYLGLAVLSARALGGGVPRRVTLRVALLAFLVAAGYGVFDEVHQSFVPGRSAELADWFADAGGAAIGIVVCWAWGIIAVRSDV